MNHHYKSPHPYEHRQRALKAKEALGNQMDWEKAFVYDAFLTLLSRGTKPTVANIHSEAAKIGNQAKADYEARFGHGS